MLHRKGCLFLFLLEQAIPFQWCPLRDTGYHYSETLRRLSCTVRIGHLHRSLLQVFKCVMNVLFTLKMLIDSSQQARVFFYTEIFIPLCSPSIQSSSTMPCFGMCIHHPGFCSTARSCLHYQLPLNVYFYTILCLYLVFIAFSYLPFALVCFILAYQDV